MYIILTILAAMHKIDSLLTALQSTVLKYIVDRVTDRLTEKHLSKCPLVVRLQSVGFVFL